MVSVSVRYLFSQPINEKIKTCRTLRFPAKENPNIRKALFGWPIVFQYDVKARYRLISRKFFGHEVFSPERSRFPHKSKTFASIHSLHNAILKICFASLAVRHCARAKTLQLNEFNIFFKSVLLKSPDMKQRVFEDVSHKYSLGYDFFTIFLC